MGVILLKDKVNEILISEIKLLNILQENLEIQRGCAKNNQLFELDEISVEISKICKKIAEIEIKLREILGQKSLKDFVMENKNYDELYGSYIFLVSQVERLSLIKNDNKFIIQKSLNFINKLLSSIDNNSKQSNVYTRKMNHF